jgi:hypothetical protein
MGLAEEKAAEGIRKQVKEISKVAKKFNFQDLAAQVSKLKVLVEKANTLPGANPKVDTEAYEYPFEKVSAYLSGSKDADVVAKIEAAAPAHACGCAAAKCECATSNESVCQIQDLNCQFCDEKIAMGKPVHISQPVGAKMCQTCARILWEKVRLKESVLYAVINLVEDASSEADPPYLQFNQSLKLVEEAQRRLEEFRLVQRAKVAR